MKPRQIALIGAGVMGGNHARVIAATKRAELNVVVDVDQSRARQLAARFGTSFSTDVEVATTCDAAIVATATEAHHPIATFLLDAGVPTLIEKPVSKSFEEVEVLCSKAAANSVPILCGFVERFNPVIDTVKGLLTDEPIHIVTMRHSPAAPRIADSVVYDLLIHDIDLALRLMGVNEVVKATGASWIPEGSSVAEIADCTLRFGNGALATLSATRAGQRKLRLIQVFTRTTLAELDLLRSDITIYRNVRHEQRDDPNSLTYRAETIVDIPFVRHAGEPLALQLEHFLDMIEQPEGLSDVLDRIIATHRVAAQVAEVCGPQADEYADRRVGGS